MATDLDLATPETITVTLEQLLNLIPSDSKNPVKIIIDNGNIPLDIHFTGTVGFTSDKNLMISTPEGITNFNPVNIETNEVITINELDEYSEFQKEAIKHAKAHEENTECLLHGKHISYEELLLKVDHLSKITEILLRHVPQSVLLEKELKCLQ